MTDNLIELYDHQVARRSHGRTHRATDATRVIPPDPAWAAAEPGEWLQSHPGLKPGIYEHGDAPAVVIVHPDDATNPAETVPFRVSQPAEVGPELVRQFRGLSIFIAAAAQVLIVVAVLAVDYPHALLMSLVVAGCGVLLTVAEWIAAYRP